MGNNNHNHNIIHGFPSSRLATIGIRNKQQQQQQQRTTTTTTTTPKSQSLIPKFNKKRINCFKARGGGGGGGSSLAVIGSGGSSDVKKKTMTATQKKLLNLFSGGIAGTVASCLTNPLEVVKTQLQSSSVSKAAQGSLVSVGGKPIAVVKQIFIEDGLTGFFIGLQPTLVGIIPSRSAYFYAYEKSKRTLRPYLQEGGVGNSLLSGLAAGLAGNTLTNPIWLVKTRMQLLADKTVGQRKYASYTDAIRTIYTEEGIKGFYKGIFASYWGCAEGSVQFILYEQFKTRLLQWQKNNKTKKNHYQQQQSSSLSSSSSSSSLLYSSEEELEEEEKLPKWLIFSAAAVAKCIASISTYPHEVARTRLREQARSGVFKYHGMWQTIHLVGREEGRKGLYAGMGVHLMKVVPNSAIMFLTYEVVNSWLAQYTIVENQKTK